jgi:hypothetical protein
MVLMLRLNLSMYGTEGAISVVVVMVIVFVAVMVMLEIRKSTSFGDKRVHSPRSWCDSSF